MLVVTYQPGTRVVTLVAIALAAGTVSVSAPRNEDIAVTIRQGEELAHALDPYVNYPLPEGIGSLERPRLPPSAPPAIGQSLQRPVRDVWGTSWHVETDPRRVRDVTFEEGGVRYSYRGTENFWLRSAGRDRKLRTPDDILVDAAGHLWRAPEGVRLPQVFESAELAGVAARQAMIVSDGVKLYVADRGGCPHRFPGSIDELRREGYIDEQLMLDGWGRPWDFCIRPVPPTFDSVEILVSSAGEDGAWSTDDDVPGGEAIAACVPPPPPPQAGCEPVTRADISRLPRDEAVANVLTRLGCADAEIRMVAYEAAGVLADPSFLDPMILRYPEETPNNRARIVHLLATLKDRRGLPTVLSGLGEIANAPEALRDIGSAANLAEAIAAYLEPRTWTPERRLRVLTVLVDWAPANDFVLHLVEDAFDRADEKARGELASLALKAQLETDKPPAPGMAPITDVADCRTWQDWQRELVPYSRREVDRILRPGNRKFLQAVGFGQRQEAWMSFHTLSVSLPPEERVALWRKTIAAFGDDEGDPGSWNCAPYAARQALVLALISMASTWLPGNVADAERLLHEADSVSEGARALLVHNTPPPEIGRVIGNVRARIQRLAGMDEARAPRLPRHFVRGGAVGHGAGELFLESGGTYRRVTYTDIVQIPCDPRGERVIDGRYAVERGFLLLSPAVPTGPADVPESYRIVDWAGSIHLVEDEATFCATAAATQERVMSGRLGKADGETRDEACRRLFERMGSLVAVGEGTAPVAECPPALPELCRSGE